jgi:hypothetical protein
VRLADKVYPTADAKPNKVRAHAKLHRHHAFAVVAVLCQTPIHGQNTRATRCECVKNGCVMFLFVLPPRQIILMCLVCNKQQT